MLYLEPTFYNRRAQFSIFETNIYYRRHQFIGLASKFYNRRPQTPLFKSNIYHRRAQLPFLFKITAIGGLNSWLQHLESINGDLNYHFYFKYLQTEGSKGIYISNICKRRHQFIGF